MFGRGSYDMKDSLAAQMARGEGAGRTPERKLRGDVVIAAVADEEYGSFGTADLIRHLKPTRPSSPSRPRCEFVWRTRAICGSKSRPRGRAAHGSRFEQGVDANMRMGRFLRALDRWSTTCARARRIRWWGRRRCMPRRSRAAKA